MLERRCRLCVLSALLVLAAARVSTADPVVIYSNFGPSPGYLSQGWDSSEENNYYMGFRLNEAAVLSSVMLPVELVSGQPADFSVGLYPSQGGRPDFSRLIERIIVPFPADMPTGSIMMFTLASSLRPTLSADTLYFIDAIPTRLRPTSFPYFGTRWPWNNAGIEGSIGANSPAGLFISQRTLGAFQLTGELSPAPEPATMVLFATGAGLILRRARSRRS